MKIVHICMTGPVTDGWNYQDNLLSKYHRKNGFYVTFITSQWIWGTNGKLEKYERSDYVNEDDVKMIRLPIIGKDVFVRKFKRYEGFKKTIQQEHPDILFVHNVSFLDSLIIADYCREDKNVKMFVDNHMDFSNSASNWYSKNILHKIIWKYCAHKLEPFTVRFYGVLPARVDFLVDMYDLPKEKCDLLVMGADNDLVEQAARSESVTDIRNQYHINANDFLIMTGGKIDSAKTQTLLLMEAVQQIDNPYVKLIIFGSVEDALIEKVKGMTDGKRIQYIGWLSARDTYRYFAAANLAVFPGRHSIFWEQVAGQGIPMVCKLWDGTTHVDVGGNVKFLMRDSLDEVREMLITITKNSDIYNRMKLIAETEGKKCFSYRCIADRSIQG